LVVGGMGFYGARVARALEARGHTVSRGTRRPEGREGAVRIDLNDPSTFGALQGFDAIANCSDSVGAAPDEAIGHVLEVGGLWLEMGADSVSTDRLFAIEAGPEARGTAVVGVGVFPGLSTALARAVAEDGPSCDTLVVGVRVSPLSGSGSANCTLMAETLFEPALRFEGGRRVFARTAVGPVLRLPFDGVEHSAANLALPDTVLVQRATKVETVGAYMALVPGVMRLNFTVLAWCLWPLASLRRPLVRLIAWQLTLLRAWLLRGVESRLQLVAVADQGRPTERSRGLTFADGQEATAAGVVAAVQVLVGRETPAGVVGLAEVCRLEELLEAADGCGVE